jgi:hypothetical protein
VFAVSGVGILFTVVALAVADPYAGWVWTAVAAVTLWLANSALLFVLLKRAERIASGTPPRRGRLLRAIAKGLRRQS